MSPEEDKVWVVIGQTEELDIPVIELYNNKPAATTAKQEIEDQNSHVGDLEVSIETREIREK